MGSSFGRQCNHRVPGDCQLSDLGCCSAAAAENFLLFLGNGNEQRRRSQRSCRGNIFHCAFDSPLLLKKFFFFQPQKKKKKKHFFGMTSSRSPYIYTYNGGIGMCVLLLLLHRGCIIIIMIIYILDAFSFFFFLFFKRYVVVVVVECVQRGLRVFCFVFSRPPTRRWSLSRFFFSFLTKLAWNSIIPKWYRVTDIQLFSFSFNQKKNSENKNRKMFSFLIF